MPYRCNEEDRHDIGHEIRITGLSIKRAIAACLKNDGIDEVTSMHGYILAYLCHNSDRDVFQKDIEAHFSIGRSAVTSVLTLMEKKGYITRCSVERDARLKKILITEKGRLIDEKIRLTIDRAEECSRNGISREEMTVFLSVLAKIRLNADSLRYENEDQPRSAGKE